MYQNCKLVLLLYEEGVALFRKTQEDLDKGFLLLQKFFNLKNLGKTKKRLGIEFEEVGEKFYYIHQSTYIKKVCSLFEDFNYPISSVPIPKDEVLLKIDSPCTKEEINEMELFPIVM